MQTSGCDYLQWVSPGADDNAAAGIVQEGGIPILMSALKTFIGYERIVQCVCLTFFNISVEHCAQMIEHGALPMLKIVTKMYPGTKASDQAAVAVDRMEIYNKSKQLGK